MAAPNSKPRRRASVSSSSSASTSGSLRRSGFMAFFGVRSGSSSPQQPPATSPSTTSVTSAERVHTPSSSGSQTPPSFKSRIQQRRARLSSAPTTFDFESRTRNQVRAVANGTSSDSMDSVPGSRFLSERSNSLPLLNSVSESGPGPTNDSLVRFQPLPTSILPPEERISPNERRRKTRKPVTPPPPSPLVGMDVPVLTLESPLSGSTTKPIAIEQGQSDVNSSPPKAMLQVPNNVPSDSRRTSRSSVYSSHSQNSQNTSSESLGSGGPSPVPSWTEEVSLAPLRAPAFMPEIPSLYLEESKSFRVTSPRTSGDKDSPTSDKASKRRSLGDYFGFSTGRRRSMSDAAVLQVEQGQSSSSSAKNNINHSLRLSKSKQQPPQEDKKLAFIVVG